jgi:hypothetical protein
MSRVSHAPQCCLAHAHACCTGSGAESEGGGGVATLRCLPRACQGARGEGWRTARRRKCQCRACLPGIHCGVICCILASVALLPPQPLRPRMPHGGGVGPARQRATGPAPREKQRQEAREGEAQGKVRGAMRGH